MANVADVQVAIWSSPEFEALSNDAALLYLWSFSNPLINPAGIYRCSRAKLLDGRLKTAKLDAALAELAAADFLFYADDGYLWVRSHARNFRSPSPKTVESIRLTLLKVGRHPLVVAFLDEYRGRPVVKMPKLAPALDALAEEGLGDPFETPYKGSLSLARAENQTPSEPLVRGPGQGQGQGPGPLSPHLAVVAGARGPVRHAGKVVPAERVALAEEVLSDFNQQMGTSYGAYQADQRTPSENLSRVLTALGTHPEIDGATARRMVAAALSGRHYWEPGRPDTGNVFSRRVLERYLEQARNPAPAATPQRNPKFDRIGKQSA